MVQFKDIRSKMIRAQALFAFNGSNNDELSFNKGEFITITQAPGLVIRTLDGVPKYQYGPEDWWEGLIDSRIGWFPCNHVQIIEMENEDSVDSDNASNQNEFYKMVLEDVIEFETKHVAEIHSFLRNYLRPLHHAKIMQINEYYCILSNLEQIAFFHSNFLHTLQQIIKLAMAQHRIGGAFLKAYVHLEQLIKIYCLNHPSAVRIVVEVRKDSIQKFLDEYKNKESSDPKNDSKNWQQFCAGLSLPFRHLEKYPNFLRELYRLLPDNHIDKGDTQRAMELYSSLLPTLREIRKQKEFEIEIMVNPIEGWEGEPISNLGVVCMICPVWVVTEGYHVNFETCAIKALSPSAISPLKNDHLFVIFPSTLLLICPNERLNGFASKGKIPLSDLRCEPVKETQPLDTEMKTAFIITGPLIEPILGACHSVEARDLLVETIRQRITTTNNRRSDHSSKIVVLDERPSSRLNVEKMVRPDGEEIEKVHTLKTEIFQPAIPLNAKVSTSPSLQRAALSDRAMVNRPLPAPLQRDEAQPGSNTKTKPGPPPLNVPRRKLFGLSAGVSKGQGSHEKYSQGGARSPSNFTISPSPSFNTSLNNPQALLDPSGPGSFEVDQASIIIERLSLTSGGYNVYNANTMDCSGLYEKPATLEKEMQTKSISTSKLSTAPKPSSFLVVRPLPPARPKLMGRDLTVRTPSDIEGDSQVMNLIDSLCALQDNHYAVPDQSMLEESFNTLPEPDGDHVISSQLLYHVLERIEQLSTQVEGLKYRLDYESLARRDLEKCLTANYCDKDQIL